jgi:hypothetical protein
MRRISNTALFLLAIAGLSIYKPGNGPATTNSSAFSGTWKGKEDCKGVSAPVAVVVITADGPEHIFLTGIYSLQGKVSGLINGDTIIIAHQLVKDPNFTNLEIEGTITMATTKRMMTGNLKVINNDTHDNCTVTYRK